MEFTLLAAAASGIAAMLGMLRWSQRSLLEGEWPEGLKDALYSAVGAGIVVGRLGSMISNGTNPLRHPADILLVRGGVSTVIASLAALAVLAVSLRKDLRRNADLVTPAILAGLAGWHGGCLFRSTCAGTLTDLPWAITIPGSQLGRHPVDVYAAALFLFAALLVCRLSIGSGLVAATGFALASIIRFATEPLRASLSGGPSGWYIAGALIGVIAALAAFRASSASSRAP